MYKTGPLSNNLKSFLIFSLFLIFCCYVICSVFIVKWIEAVFHSNNKLNLKIHTFNLFFLSNMMFNSVPLCFAS